MTHNKLTADDYKFMAYVSEYGRSYGTLTEFLFRAEIYHSKDKEIEEWNAGNNTHTLEHNEFSDRTYEEMQQMLGFRQTQDLDRKEVLLDESNLADSVDWVTKGAVTPVKNQGQCGSCWAFSTTGSVEGAMFLKTGTLQSFSESQLVDCDRLFNNGCKGGSMDMAFLWISQPNNLDLESTYPYVAKQNTCHSKKPGVGKVKNYMDVKKSVT